MDTMIKEVINFFQKNNINLIEDKNLVIKNTIIPNFFLQEQKLLNIRWEFCHLLYKIYSPIIFNNLSFYENNKYTITKEDIVFDCGANMGLFSAWAAEKGAEVYAFEPMSYTRKFLHQTQKNYPNIHIIPYALSDKEDNVFFYQCDNPGANHEISLKVNLDNDILYKEKVHCITLDNFCKKLNIYPTFIKVDVEGGEKKLLQGAANVLNKNKPVLSISAYHNKEDIKILFQLIQQINNLYYCDIFQEENGGSYLFCK